ncbi:hypothetical protein [Hydrogenivirga sp.]
MWRFLLRFRLLLWLLRFVLFPLFVLALLLLVFALIGVSLYGLLLAKTLSGVRENPYIFLPLLVLEVAVVVSVLYAVMVYINKILKYKKSGGK